MMKQKKIIVPILTLAVMLLMVGGVYAVFSSTQPEKSKAENVRDTTDQDYEKGLTEEQKAFNELINKQIYEETANNLEQYEQYGLTYNSNENSCFLMVSQSAILLITGLPMELLKELRYTLQTVILALLQKEIEMEI